MKRRKRRDAVKLNLKKALPTWENGQTFIGWSGPEFELNLKKKDLEQLSDDVVLVRVLMSLLM